MFSDALRQLDKNTELYMIEILEKKNKELLDTYNTLQSENSNLQTKNSNLRNENSNLQNENSNLQKEIEALKLQLQTYQNNS